jgi:hypothetical protein
VVIEQYVWVILVVGMLIGIPIHWRGVRPHIEAHPELLAGYRRLIYWRTFWLSLPWLVMGLGFIVGGVPSLAHFLRPMIGGPFVWAFWGVWFTEFLLLGYWSIWCGGAEALIAHPGVMGDGTDSVQRMKWFLGGLVVFCVVCDIGLLVLVELTRPVSLRLLIGD